MEPLYDLGIPLFGICPQELKSSYYGGTYPPVCIAAQFTIAKLWNQPTCPSTNEWIKKMYCIYIYTRGITKNEIMSFARK